MSSSDGQAGHAPDAGSAKSHDIRVDWYFDFISPFAYLAHERLSALPASLTVQRRPVLLAGLLEHWGQRGPAEIPGKRLYTYRYCTWLAERSGVPFALPAQHPFPPLPALRLAVACGASAEATRAIFRHLWVGGHDAGDPGRFEALVEQLARGGARPDPTAPAVKRRLRENTDEARSRGVFGVPTAVVQHDGEDLLFFGLESLEVLRDFAEDPALFDTASMGRLRDLPIGAVRPSR